MFDAIDPRSPTPLYAQIATEIRLAVASGELRTGDALPSVRALSSRLRINPATVVQAYRELETEGTVDMRQGAGTFVSDAPATRTQRALRLEATRLVRGMLEQGSRIGLTAADLRSALDEELGGRKP